MVGDFDGDGRDEVAFRPTTNANMHVWIPGANSNAGAVVTGWVFSNTFKPVVGDFNGDGADDFYQWVYPKPLVRPGVNLNGQSATGWPFGAGVQPTNVGEQGVHDLAYAGDIDGDGVDDVVLKEVPPYGDDEKLVFLRGTSGATGWPFTPDTGTVSGDLGAKEAKLIVGDFDPDVPGQEILLTEVGVADRLVRHESGTLVAGTAPNDQETNWNKYVVGDFDGDGDDDLFW
jgi:hypothetical protein